MARQQEQLGVRIHGPYDHRDGRRQRVVLVDADGRRSDRYFESEEDAKQFIKALKRKLRKLNAKSLEDALEEYRMYLRDEKGNKPKSVTHTVDQLVRFFGGTAGTVDEFEDHEACEAKYEALRQSKKKDGKPLAVDTHRNALAQAKTFLNWCVTKGFIKTNAMMNVKGKGRRRYGKEQLHIDEARRWSAAAVTLVETAEREDAREGALKALMSLHLGLRASEILLRQVRDVDDDGAVLWIPDSKTRAGRRRVEVPLFLRRYLVEQAKGRDGAEPLFAYREIARVRRWVQRICETAKVKKVSAHAMRGLHGTLAVDAGVTSHAVAAALGHESFKTTAASYAKREAVAGAQHKKASAALMGGGNDAGPSEPSAVYNKTYNGTESRPDASI